MQIFYYQDLSDKQLLLIKIILQSIFNIILIIHSPEINASFDAKNTILVSLIELLRKHPQMYLNDIMYFFSISSSLIIIRDYVSKNMNNFAKICGRRYSGSPERVTLGALYIIEYDN